MNTAHAKEILQELQIWFAVSESGPSAGSLLFADDATLKTHIDAALAGVPMVKLQPEQGPSSNCAKCGKRLGPTFIEIDKGWRYCSTRCEETH